MGGVYTNWIDCYAQASGYQDCVVRLHDTAQEGIDAWSVFSISCTSSLISKKRVELMIDSNGGCPNEILSNIIEILGL